MYSHILALFIGIITGLIGIFCLLNFCEILGILITLIICIIKIIKHVVAKTINTFKCYYRLKKGN